MKICIYGAGATGSVLAQTLHAVGQEVSLIARGEHLKAIQKRGLRVVTPAKEYHLPIMATDRPEILQPQDAVIIASKAYSLPEIAPKIPALLHEKSLVIPVCNGIPWWFLYGLKGTLRDRDIHCLDPEGVIRRHIPFDRVIGGVIYMAAALREHGVATSNASPRFIVGAPDGDVSEQLAVFDRIRSEAGFKDAMTANIRCEILHKLSWNIVFNPLSVITGMDSGQLAANANIRATVFAALAEMQCMGDALDLRVAFDPERQIALAEKAGHHKPSMLQDFAAGKTIEIDALLGGVMTIAGMLNMSVPTIQEIHKALKAAIAKPSLCE